MSNQVICSKDAPAAIGPYSQAIKANKMIFTSGQIPINPTTGKIEDETIENQTKQALTNLKAVLKEGGAELSDVIKTVVYLADLGDFAVVNEIYSQYFAEPFPARSCFQVAALPAGAKIEIEAVASL